MLRHLFPFVVPGGLLFSAAVLTAPRPEFVNWFTLLNDVFPYVVFAVALLLGWRFDRSRLVFATVIIGVGGWILLTAGSGPTPAAHHLTKAVALLLPLNIALIALLKERGLFTWHGMLRWVLIGLQPAALAALWYWERHDWLMLLDARFLPLAADLPVPQPALVAFAGALALTGVQGFRRRGVLEYGLFWALAVVLFALWRQTPAPVTAVLFGAAILILVIAVVETSYAMAFRDELTGLPGRRALNQALLKLGGRYTVAMLDVDHFKKFNDRYGHDVGDQVLKMVAAKMRGLTGGGRAFRYGGEEFTILLPGRGVEESLEQLEQVRAAIAESPFTVRSAKRRKNKPPSPRKGSNQRVKITISIGAAERERQTRAPQEVIKAADKALYRAKKAGRNRVAL